MYLIKFFTLIRNEFKVRDQILIAIILCSLLVVIVGIILFINSKFSDIGKLIFTAGETIAELIGLIFLLRHSSIMKSKYWRYIVVSVLIVIMSGVFKILHLQGATALLLVGFILLELIYTVHFVCNVIQTQPVGSSTYGFVHGVLRQPA